MRRFICLICFVLITAFFGVSPSYAGKGTHKPAVLKTDTSSLVSVRHFDSTALKAYSRQPEFQYKEDKLKLSWWDRFWRWFWNWLNHLFDFGPKKNAQIGHFVWAVFFKYLFIVLGIAAVVFLVLRLTGVDMLNIFRRKVTSAPIPYSEFFEDINAISFDREIENAVSSANYRLAVRLLYLKCLKQLSDAGLINWEINKTNTAYIHELKDENRRSAFSRLTRQFEYVWYGEFMINEPVYSDINSSFSDFSRHLA